MPLPTKRRVLRWCILLFRWTRIAVWVLVLVVLCSLLYLSKVGLPHFLKRPILARLEEKQLGLEFQRMRLHWYRGLVVDKPIFTRRTPPLSPHFSADEVELGLDFSALLGARVRIDGVKVFNGHLSWPFSPTNHLEVEAIQAQIAFPATNQVEVIQFSSRVRGSTLFVTGSLTNVSAIRDWPIFSRSPDPDSGKVGRSPEEWLRTLDQIQYQAAPELVVVLRGDAADLSTLRGKMKLQLPSTVTPWGTFDHLLAEADVKKLFDPDQSTPAVVRLVVDELNSSWGQGRKVDLQLRLSLLDTNQIQGEIQGTAQGVKSHWFEGTQADLAGRWTQDLTNPIPLRASMRLKTGPAKTPWATASSIDLSLRLTSLGHSMPAWDTNLPLASRLAPFQLEWETEAHGVKSPQMTVESLQAAGRWKAPTLEIQKLNGRLYRGGLTASGSFNTDSRQLIAKAASDFEFHQLAPLLPPQAPRWLRHFGWEHPPHLKVESSLTLPPPATPSTNWFKAILPTLTLAGTFDCGKGSYDTISLLSARTAFTYTNHLWQIPFLEVRRPEGNLDLTYTGHDQTGDFRFGVKSHIDLNILRPLFPAEAEKVFDLLTWSEPPTLQTEFSGQWGDLERIRVSGTVAATNFQFRGYPIDSLQTSALYTNRAVYANEVRLRRGVGRLEADAVSVDTRSEMIHITNGYSTMDPVMVTRAIGKVVANAVDPYRFAHPPIVKAQGGFSYSEVEKANIVFTIVDGRDFSWGPFRADAVKGVVDWKGMNLYVTNIQALAYNGGRIGGWAAFDFTAPVGTDFKFEGQATNVDLHAVMLSLNSSNKTEGLLNGQVTMAHANTDDYTQWQGAGWAHLREGLIWEIPLFGIFSPMLEAISPDLGKSRAREGSASFVITNGVAYTDDLEIKATGLHMEYRGTLDYKKNVDARVSAELLRDTWLVGRIVSFALSPITKLFEYRVTGHFDNPKTEPVYIPKFLMMTLRPFHTLKQLLPEKSTNAPPPVPESKP